MGHSFLILCWWNQWRWTSRPDTKESSSILTLTMANGRLNRFQSRTKRPLSVTKMNKVKIRRYPFVKFLNSFLFFNFNFFSHFFCVSVYTLPLVWNEWIGCNSGGYSLSNVPFQMGHSFLILILRLFFYFSNSIFWAVSSVCQSTLYSWWGMNE